MVFPEASARYLKAANVHGVDVKRTQPSCSACWHFVQHGQRWSENICGAGRRIGGGADRRPSLLRNLRWAYVVDCVASNDEPSLIFTPLDHLRLLQLQAQRAIADRRLVSSQHSAAPVSEVATLPTLPEKWRLVPEGVTLFAWQSECLPLWLEHGRGTIKVATGGGKTLFALAAAQALQNQDMPDLRVVVVVPTIPLMLQWVDELRKGNLPDSAIGLMGGGHELPLADQVRVLVCVLASARERLPKFVRDADFSHRLLLIVDECHRANAEQAVRIFEAKPRYTLGLSATPEDMEYNPSMPTGHAYAQSPVGQALGPIIYEYALRQCHEDGLLTSFELWHVGLPLSSSETLEHLRLSREIADLRIALERHYRSSKSRLGFLAWCQVQTRNSTDALRFIQLASSRKRLLYRARARVEVTLGILREQMVDTDSRAILFHESIDEVEEIFLAAVSAQIPAVLEHSELPAYVRREGIEAFRSGAARVVVSAKSLVEGFNVPSADVGIIIASSASVRQRIQSLGRLLRRKKDGRTARVYILYVHRTEDEAIYEKTDWDAVVGATVNRYFVLRSIEGGKWSDGLREVGRPPRRYLPPAAQVDVSALLPGDSYQGRADGVDLKVDLDGNLRIAETNQLVPAPRELVDFVLENPYRRARFTPAGHLICRLDDDTPYGWSWRYVGRLELPELHPEESLELRLGSRSGRRFIIRKLAGGDEAFAKGPEDTVKKLLAWVAHVGNERSSKPISKLFWNGGGVYWVEIAGERITFQDRVASLEF